MIKLIDKKVVNYCESNIIPKYQALDRAHREEHVYAVISKSFDIAKNYDVKPALVYIIACFHDLGLLIDRKRHHIEGGRLLSEDAFINEYFTIEDIKLMKEAIEDHRASNQMPPRSIYGKIISEADRLIDPEVIVKRSFLYQMNLETDHSFEHLYPIVREHIVSKYGYGGYLNLWLKYEKHEEILNDFRKVIDDEKLFRKMATKIYSNL